MKKQENIGYASVNSSYALPPPPWTNSWEFAFFLMDGKFMGAGALN